MNSCSVSTQPTIYCTTCSDEAMPALVLRIDEATAMAFVIIKGSEIEVDISLVNGVTSGDWLLVHGGVALAMLADKLGVQTTGGRAGDGQQ